jgi:hypothetical protein
MTVETRTEFVGLQDAIKSLKKINPEFRREFNSNAKDIVKPLIAEVRSKYPSMPLSGMKYGWSQRGRSLFPWTISKVKTGVKFKTSTRRNTSSVLYVTQMDPGAAIFEIAGQANPGATFNKNLRSKADRVLWPTFERRQGEIERGLSELVKDAMKTVEKELR